MSKFQELAYYCLFDVSRARPLLCLRAETGPRAGPGLRAESGLRAEPGFEPDPRDETGLEPGFEPGFESGLEPGFEGGIDPVPRGGPSAGHNLSDRGVRGV